MRYEPLRRELLVAFRGGRGTYRYFDVSAQEWRAFLNAESKGTYLNEIFKKKEHLYIRLMDSTRNVEGASLGAGENRPVEDEPAVWGEAWSLPKAQVQHVRADKTVEKIRA
jgi:hypothetical protein